MLKSTERINGLNEYWFIRFVEQGEPKNPGEWQLKRWLRINHYLVTDVSDWPEYQVKDIDIVAQKPNSRDNITIEVKWDTRIGTTGNLFIETDSNIQTGRPGWFNYCEADYLAYGDANADWFYIFDWKKLKEYVKAHRSEFNYRTAPTYSNGKFIKQNGGLLVPLDQVKEFVVEQIDVSEVYKIKDGIYKER